MEYVYRYLDGSETVYVGITNNMRRRVREHTTDKLSGLSEIEYFAVRTRTDAEMLETYLISQYKPRLNISKTEKGDVSFLGDMDFPWQPYVSKFDKPLEPFSVKKPKNYRPISGEQRNMMYINAEIKSEREIIGFLQRLEQDDLNPGVDVMDVCEGIILHRLRFIILLQLSEIGFETLISDSDRKRREELINEGEKIFHQITEHEKGLEEKTKRTEKENWK